MLVILVVLYNKSLNSSLSLSGIFNSYETLNKNNCKIIVADNSPNKLSDEDFTILKKTIISFEYHHFPDNKPLSVVYNRFIDTYKNQDKYKYLVLLDDDSAIDENYFSSVFNAIKTNEKCSLFLPVVYNNGLIKSPEKDYIIKPIRFSSIKAGHRSSKYLTAINSGMVISFLYFKKYEFHYDTWFKNYGTDSYFMKCYRQNEQYLHILSYSFNHSLSFYDTIDEMKRLAVFKEAKEGRKKLYDDTHFASLLVFIYNIAASAKNSIKHKSLKYFS